MNFPLVLHYLGVMVGAFSLTVLLLIPVAILLGEWPMAVVALESALIGMAAGAALYFGTRHARGEVYRREGLAIVGLSWLLVPFVGALPFLLGGMVESTADAYFESVSGITTTGSSILVDIEAQPRTLLFWRAFLQFMGGLGIILFFVAVLPLLGVGGKTLYRQEITGPMPQILTPRIKDTAIQLIKLYLALHVLLIVAYILAGMGLYDAATHAMTCISTAGFSPRNESIGAYNEAIHWITIVFMIIGGTSFILHLRVLRGGIGLYFRDTQFRWYIGILLGAVVIQTIVLHASGWREGLSDPDGFHLRDVFFATTSIMTTTGYSDADWDQWPTFNRVLLFLLMFAGGMSGSTAGSIKIVRWIVLIKTALHQFVREADPRRVKLLKVDGKPIPLKVQSETFIFFFTYVAVFGVGCLLLTLLMPWQDFVSSLAAVSATLNIVGPGFGEVGPELSFASQSSAAKWLLSLLMLIGRLELYAILVLFAPGFWRGR